MNKKEIFRKFFHLIFLFTIPLTYYTSIRLTQFLLILFGLFYYILEQLRLKGKQLPLFYYISRYTLREKEKDSVAFAPITLALGILLVLELYTVEAMRIAVIAVTIGDSLAAIVGLSFSKPKLWWNKAKSFWGTFANFLSVFLVSLLFIGPYPAFIAALVSASVESLDLEHVDNLMIPLSVGAAFYIFHL